MVKEEALQHVEGKLRNITLFTHIQKIRKLKNPLQMTRVFLTLSSDLYSHFNQTAMWQQR